MRASGSLRLAHAWFDEGTVRLVFDPLIADWQRECETATGPRLLWSYVRGLATFVSTFSIAMVSEPGVPLPPALALGTWMTTAVFILLGVGVLYGSVIIQGHVPLGPDLALWRSRCRARAG